MKLICRNGKVVYLSQSEADKARHKQLKEFGQQLRIYRCPWCLEWHLTSQLKEKKRVGTQ